MHAVVRGALASVVGPALRRAGVALEAAGGALGGAQPLPAYVAAKPDAEVPSWVDVTRPSTGAPLEHGSTWRGASLGRDGVPQGVQAQQEGLVPVDSAFVAPSAAVSGASLGRFASVWYHARVAGAAVVGNGACILDGAIVEGSASAPVEIGSKSMVGARAQLAAGVRVQDQAIVGHGAILEENVEVESRAVVGPGAVVRQGSKVGRGEYWAGAPAIKVREVEPIELDSMMADVDAVEKLAPLHAKEHAKDIFLAYAEREAFENRYLFTETALEEMDSDWDVFVSVDVAPDEHPERPGLIFNKRD